MNEKAMGWQEFVKAALRDPKNVSTPFPSSKALAEAMIEASQLRFNDRVLELGSGSGAITQSIAARGNLISNFLGVELDPQLVNYLKVSYPKLDFVQASATDLSEHVADQSVDRVISSLPWSLFNKEMQLQILSEIHRVLKPGGTFVTFLCLHAQVYPGGLRVKKLFNSHFKSFERHAMVGMNIPPAGVYRAKI